MTSNKKTEETQEPSRFESKYQESVLFSGAGQVIERALRIAVMIVVVRLLSQEEYGIYGVLISSASIIGVLTTWGWPSVFMRYIPQLKEEGNRRLITSLVVKGLSSRLLVTATGIVLVLVFFEEVGGFLNLVDYYQYFLIFAAGIFATIMVGLLKVVLNAHLEHRLTYTTTVVGTLVKDVLFVAVLLLGAGLTGLLLVETAVLLATSVILGWYIWKQMLVPAHLTQLRSIPKRIKKYSAFSYLNDVGTFFLDISIDTMIIAKYMGVEYVALYTVGATIPKRIRKFMPTSLLRNVLEPMTYSSYTRDPSDENLNRIFHLLTKVNYVILIPVFSVIVLFGRELMGVVFGEKYIGSYPYLVFLSFFFFAKMFPIGYVTKSKEKMHINALSKVFSVYNLILDIVLIQLIGLLGVVLATGSAQLFKAVYIYWHTKRFVSITFPVLPLLKVASLSFGLFGGVKVMYMAGASVGLALVAGVLMTGLLGMSIMKTGYFSAWEIESLQEVLGSLTGRRRLVRRLFAVVS